MFRDLQNEKEAAGALLKAVRDLKQLCTNAEVNYELLVASGKVAKDPGAEKPGMRGILETVAACFRLSEEEILSDCRRRELAVARQTCCYAAYYWGYRVEKIGNYMRIGHSAVSASCKVIRDLLNVERDEYYGRVVKSLKLIHYHG